MMEVIKCMFLLLCVTLELGYAAKILMLPYPHYSTVNFYVSAGKGLIKNGHDVWVVGEEQYKQKINKGGMKHILLTSDAWANFQEMLTTDEMIHDLSRGQVSIFALGQRMMKSSRSLCEDTLADKKMLADMKDINFDLLIIDSNPVFSCCLLFPYQLEKPFIVLGVLAEPWGLGITSMPSTEPSPVSSFTNKMTFMQRAANTLMYMMTYVMTQMTYGDDYAARFAPDMPPVTMPELATKAEMWLTNYEITCVDYPRMTGPHHIFIGGASASPPKPLTGDIAKFVNEAEHGVILLTFGSFKPFRSTLRFLLDRLLEGFGRVKQRVILQYKDEIKTQVPDNVWPMAWLPQNDLLGHPNTVLFITHGGNNGQMEAAYHGVPMLAIPIMDEQKYNAIRMINRGYGQMIDLANFTSDGLVEAIEHITSDPSYKSNIAKCSRILKTYSSPQDNIVFWVNHVLEFGGAHLRPPGMDMPLYKIFNLDVFAFLFVILITIVVSLVFCCCYIFRKCNSKGKAKSD